MVAEIKELTRSVSAHRARVAIASACTDLPTCRRLQLQAQLSALTKREVHITGDINQLTARTN